MNIKTLRELIATMDDNATVFIGIDKSDSYRACYEVTDAEVSRNGIELISQYHTDYSSELEIE